MSSKLITALFIVAAVTISSPALMGAPLKNFDEKYVQQVQPPNYKGRNKRESGNYTSKLIGFDESLDASTLLRNECETAQVLVSLTVGSVQMSLENRTSYFRVFVVRDNQTPVTLVSAKLFHRIRNHPEGGIHIQRSTVVEHGSKYKIYAEWQGQSHSEKYSHIAEEVVFSYQVVDRSRRTDGNCSSGGD